MSGVGLGGGYLIAYPERTESQQDDEHYPEEGGAESVVACPWSGHGDGLRHGVGSDDGHGVVHLPQFVAIAGLPLGDGHIDGVALSPSVTEDAVVLIDVDAVEPHFDPHGVALVGSGCLVG